LVFLSWRVRMILVTNNEGTSGAPVTARMLREGAATLPAIEAGIRVIEADPTVRTVGRGGWPNLLGEVELDAAVMDGTTLRVGAVGALKGFLHPISVARAVMERLPHVFLVGEGAARFAREIGAEPGENLTPDSERVWRAWYEKEVPEASKRRWSEAPLIDLCKHAVDPEVGHDTTVFIALDSKGEIGGGVSTSGWGWKYPGRLGDSPVLGAGMYADSRYGACACTGAGEMTIRAGTSRAVVLYMKMGMSVDEAVREAIEDMRRLKGGLIDRVTIHAIGANGQHKVVAVNGDANTYWLWRDGDTAPQSLPAEIVTISPKVPRLPPSTKYGGRQRSVGSAHSAEQGSPTEIFACLDKGMPERQLTVTGQALFRGDSRESNPADRGCSCYGLVHFCCARLGVRANLYLYDPAPHTWRNRQFHRSYRSFRRADACRYATACPYSSTGCGRLSRGRAEHRGAARQPVDLA
jgi:L-asparaginase